MIIPGVNGPGNDIDIYLQPLIKELKQLWVGLQTYDASRKQNFNLRAALMWRINDFPAYAILSGWRTKGKYACPCCAAKTASRWLSNGQKFCYMGHRRWLAKDHPYRLQKHLFDGTLELREAPLSTSGSNILLMLNDVQYSYGKRIKQRLRKSKASSSSKKRQRQESNFQEDSVMDKEEDESQEADLWKKRSIFFDLPYWEHLLMRHNLDVMHIEKNVCENIIGTLLNVDGKSKDNLKARLDLVDMGIRHVLHPEYLPNGRTRLPPAIYSMTKGEKDVFCQVSKNIKVPDGYSSNISRCVNQKERKLHSLKSHDHHILLHDLLPIALRLSSSKQVMCSISELCNIFKILCGKVLNVEELDKLQYRASMVLCQLEKIFPPSFFTIMVHLLIHLPLQAKLGGPVHYQWMYPIERFLLKLKNYVRNKRYPEGSIVEGYLAEECVTFCSRYLEDVETIFDKPSRNLGEVHDEALGGTYLFHSHGQPIRQFEITELDAKSLAQAHRYVLLHHDVTVTLQSEYKNILRQQMRARRSTARDVDMQFTKTFHEWLAEVVSRGRNVTEEVRFLAQGPNRIVKRYKGYIINGFRFHTKSRERLRRTQNSGCVVTSSTADVTNSRGIKKDKYGFTMVNFSRLIHTGANVIDEPYVFSSQVKQVFYSKDLTESGWYVVIRNHAREVYDMGDESTESGPRTDCFPTSSEGILSSNDDEQWVHEDANEDVYAA
ncbi:uncharacterized protein LOC120251857 [Dioscorea cayenensis subsp. rotundata]|uniref:Uncharacterized protein LOC120251857 n=1 Tax=Dioscorea cayennensis subsp. rotundata TaxID=55577 RepID=A0AB40AQE1_DIOCR|nr:uncharacterized protein LOC120251857 [Dioscorea cayenensis subsp. rotundata]